MKKSAGLLGVLLAVALTGCGISSAVREAPAKARVPSTTTPATIAPSTQPSTTAAPTTAPVRPDLTNLVHTWSVHCCGLKVDGAGHFEFAGRTYVWCEDGPPPCDRMVGNEIHDGAMANGVIVSRTGNVARARVTFTSDAALVPRGAASFVYDPASDTLTIQPTGVVLCGPSAAPRCFGA